MKFKKWIVLMKSICLILLIFSACSPKPIARGEPDAYGCIAPPASTFASVGADISVAQSTIGKVVTGDIKIKTQPEVINLLSKSVVDQELLSYLRCLAINQNKFTPEQAAYLESMFRFSATNPSPGQFQKWQDSNPFPKKSQESALVVYDLIWTNATGKNQAPDLDKAIDIRHAQQIGIEGYLLNNVDQHRNIKLEILTSAKEDGTYINYYEGKLRNDGSINFGLTPKPGFMKLRLHVNDGKKADFKGIVSVTY